MEVNGRFSIATLLHWRDPWSARYRNQFRMSSAQLEDVIHLDGPHGSKNRGTMIEDLAMMFNQFPTGLEGFRYQDVVITCYNQQ